MSRLDSYSKPTMMFKLLWPLLVPLHQFCFLLVMVYLLLPNLFGSRGQV